MTLDIRTLILLLALGNVVFGTILFLFQLREEPAHRNTQWTAAKGLQALGWFLLYFRGSISELLSYPVGNACLLSGFACECWAIFRISGRVVSVKTQALAISSIVIACACINPWLAAMRIATASYISVIFFALSGWAMLKPLGPGEQRSLLRMYVGWSMWLLAAIVSVRGGMALFFPGGFVLFSDNWSQEVTFLSMYFLMLTNGFGMLLLTKEASDRELADLSKEQEAILDTLPSGLCILRDRVIERCNPAMEAMFGYAPGTLAGNSARILHESDEAFERHGQRFYEEIERSGRFEGEMACVRRNGERFCTLACGTTIFPDRAQTYAICSMADLSELKRQHEMLALQKQELEATLARAKRLEGIISICMYCKRIDNKRESWEQLEKYITAHSDALFSHGICPDCLGRQFPERARNSG